MPLLSQRLFKLATQNASEYLVSLNLKALQKSRKRGKDEDPRAFYEALRKEAEKGPLFSQTTVEAIHHCPVDLQKNETQWLATLLQAPQPHGERDSDRMPYATILRGVIDWIRAENPTLEGLSWAQAHHEAEAWHRTFVKDAPVGEYETKKVVMEFPNGYTMVEVPVEDLDTEGDYMGHCVGGDDYEEKVKNGGCTIYSLRDKENRPHVTIEVEWKSRWGTTHREPYGEVEQIQGKENKQPIGKYHAMIHQFLHREGLHLDGASEPFASDEGVLGKLAQGDNFKELKQVTKSPHLTPKVSETVWSNPSIQAAVTGDNFSENDLYVIVAYLAENPRTSPAVLSAIHSVNPTDSVMNAYLAENPSTPATILQTFARMTPSKLASKLASNPSLPPELLQDYFKEGLKRAPRDALLLAAVARNPKATPEMLTKAAKELKGATNSGGMYVLAQALARNPYSPAKVLHQLALDYRDEQDEEKVLVPVAQNPNVTPDTLHLILAGMGQGSYRGLRKVLVAIDKRTDLTDKQLIAMMDEQPYLAEFLAERPKPSPEIQAYILDNDNDNGLMDEARVALANNRSLSAESYEKLYEFWMDAGEDENGDRDMMDLARALARNPKVPAALLDALSDPEQPKAVRYEAAKNPSTPVASLVALSDDKNAGVCVAAIKNPNLPEATLEAIAVDPNYPLGLRETAKHELAKRARKRT